MLAGRAAPAKRAVVSGDAHNKHIHASTQKRLHSDGAIVRRRCKHLVPFRVPRHAVHGAGVAGQHFNQLAQRSVPNVHVAVCNVILVRSIQRRSHYSGGKLTFTAADDETLVGAAKARADHEPALLLAGVLLNQALLLQIPQMDFL